jgi:Tfp pilus assembly protein PilF
MIGLLLALLAAIPPSAYETNSRGAALLNRGEPLKALEAFREARSAAPGWITADVNEGIALLALGRMDEALALFDAALARDPRHVHALFNRGLARKRAGLPGAEEDFARVHEIDPEDPDALYQLAAARMDRRDHAGARQAFELLLQKDPAYLSAYFALGRVLLLLGERDKARVYLERFQELKATSPMAETVGPAYGEQGVYSLAEDVPSPPAEAAPAIRVTFRGAGWGLPADAWAGSTGIALVDLDGDRRPDLGVATAAGLRLFRNDGARFVEVARPLAVRASGIAAGDVDDDGDVDLLVGTDRGAALLLNQGGLRFAETPSAALLADGKAGRGVAMVDVDHDGDLDLLVAREAGVRLVRSAGNLAFADVTTDARLVDQGAAFGLTAVDLDGDRDVDLLVEGPEAYVLVNQRDGTFVRQPLASGVTAGGSGIAVADLDGDRFPDVVRTGTSSSIAYGSGRLPLRAEPLAAPGASRGIAPLDYDNDGLVDLAIAAGGRLAVLRNLGGRRLSDQSAAVGAAAIRDASGMAAGDVDGDGDLDLVIARDGAAPLVLRNDGGNANAWLVVDPRGLNDNKTGVGTRVEVRAGGRFQRADVLSGGGYLSQAPLTLHFGLGQSRSAGIVRLLWPTGVLQDELDAAARATLRIEELDRKGSSCPMLYAWDGTRMRFQADMIGAGVMGQWAGPGARNVSDPDEYLLVEGAVADGRGRLRFALVEQMEEVTYLDAARLVAVDHPRGVRVFPNERFAGAPPFPAFGVVQLRDAWTPVAAVDDRGTDVTETVRTRDGGYVRMPKTDLVGFARPHHLELDLGPRAEGGVARLVLRGYTEYFYPRTLYAAAQRGLAPQPPVLEVLRDGAWVKVADLGIPAGLPRYMVADLAGLLRPGERRVRIASNMEVYWDQVLVDDGRAAEAVRTTTLRPAHADLRFHGFPRRLQRDPEEFDYHAAAPAGPYARAAGLYTRYGDVAPLLAGADDRFAILGPGDAVTLDFDAAALPALPDGWERTFFFFAHGYEKDMDDHTAEPLTVEPLPFGSMSSYPYPAGEAYPSGPDHLEYRLRYNTRRVEREAWTTPAGPEPRP